MLNDLDLHPVSVELGEVDFDKNELKPQQINYDYNYLSNLFSSVEGITIEHYLI